MGTVMLCPLWWSSMSGKRALILHLLPTLSVALPRFEVHWESEKSYEDVDPLVSPWHIRLGDIDVGPPGYLGGPSVVTIDSADYCVDFYNMDVSYSASPM